MAWRMRKGFVLAAVVGVCFFLGFLVFGKSEKAAIKNDYHNTAYWGVQMEKGGSEAAYQKLRDVVSGEPVYERHDIAHAFGSALYEYDPEGALAVCELDLTGGCLHELFGKMVVSFGKEGALSKMGACEDYEENGRVCGHGSGHGFYLLYHQEGIERALEACDESPGLTYPQRCYGGVFMEHNMGTAKMAERGRREYSGDVLEPCLSLAGKKRQTCLFWQSQWWDREIFMNEGTVTSFEKMGQWCADPRLTKSDSRACQEGLGFITPFTTPEVATARVLCAAAGGSVSCYAAAAKHLSDFDFSMVQAAGACKEVPGCITMLQENDFLVFP